MKYLVASLAFFGGCLAQEPRFLRESSALSGISSVTNPRWRYSDQRALLGVQQLERRNDVYRRDVDDFFVSLLPRTSGENPKSGQHGIVRASSPRTPSNVAAVVSSEQQQQTQSQSPPRRQQLPNPTINTPRGSALPSVPRIRVTTPSAATKNSILRGRVGNFFRPTGANIDHKRPANQDEGTSPGRPIERVSSANSLASEPSPRSPSPFSIFRQPSRPLSPMSPNTILNKELDWLQKGKWIKGRQPFDGAPHGLTGDYVIAAGLYNKDPPSRPKIPGSPASLYSSSSSGLMEEVPSSMPGSPPRIQVEPPARQQQNRLLPNPWATFPPMFPPRFW